MRGKGYTVSTIVTALMGAVAIVAIVLWLLPRWGINIPIWGFILLMVAYVAYQVVTYRMGKRALDRKPVVCPEAIVDRSGKATTSLAPNGYVQVEGELWRALSTGPNIDEGEEIIVVGMKGLTLFVSAPPNGKHEASGRTFSIDKASKQG